MRKTHDTAEVRAPARDQIDRWVVAALQVVGIADPLKRGFDPVAMVAATPVAATPIPATPVPGTARAERPRRTTT